MNDVEFFLNVKPCRALEVLDQVDKTYGSELSDMIDTTYPHTNAIITKMEERDLISREKDGRKSMITLTDRGEMLAEKVSDVLNFLDEEGSEWD